MYFITLQNNNIKIKFMIAEHRFTWRRI